MNTNSHTTPQATYNHLLSLLDDLPPESLTVVERFVEFLREQARRGQPVVTLLEQKKKPPYLYPTIGVPASSLDRWLNLVPEGYEGNALADTETLYDEV